MLQVGRQLMLAEDGLLGPRHVLIWDRDATWSPDVRQRSYRSR